MIKNAINPPYAGPAVIGGSIIQGITVKQKQQPKVGKEQEERIEKIDNARPLNNNLKYVELSQSEMPMIK